MNSAKARVLALNSSRPNMTTALHFWPDPALVKGEDTLKVTHTFRKLVNQVYRKEEDKNVFHTGFMQHVHRDDPMGSKTNVE